MDTHTHTHTHTHKTLEIHRQQLGRILTVPTFLFPCLVFGDMVSCCPNRVFIGSFKLATMQSSDSSSLSTIQLHRSSMALVKIKMITNLTFKAEWWPTTMLLLLFVSITMYNRWKHNCVHVYVEAWGWDQESALISLQPYSLRQCLSSKSRVCLYRKPW